MEKFTEMSHKCSGKTCCGRCHQKEAREKEATLQNFHLDPDAPSNPWAESPAKTSDEDSRILENSPCTA